MAKVGAFLVVFAFLVSAVPVSCVALCANDTGETPAQLTETGSLGGTASRAVADWTFMVYLDADCNLESDGIDDFMEMSSIGSSTMLNIIVQMDRAVGYSSDYGDWTTCKRFRVTQSMTPTSGNALADIGEVHMGDDSTLQAFIEWTITNYPANRYALVLWDHGGGWYSGVCSDNSDGGDTLSMAELRGAISSALTAKSEHLDTIGFDACLMGMVEVAYDLRDYSDSFAFSEETEPGQGWPYDKVLTDLKGSLGMSGQLLADAVVNRYAEYYGSSGKETQSSVLSSQVTALGIAVKAFADAMIANWATVSSQVQVARAQAEEFEFTFYVDAYHFCERVRAVTGAGTVGNAAQGVMDAISAAVSEERHGDQHSNAHGLSIYFPSIASDYDQVGYASGTQFAADLTWDEFLNAYFSTTPGGGAVADAYEPDNDFTSASDLLMGETQVHSIHDSGSDIDWVTFTLTSANDVILLTEGTDGDTVIYLYDSSGVPSTPLASDDDGNGRFSRLDVNLAAGTYYLKIIEYNMNNEIASYAVSLKQPIAGDAYEPDDVYTEASPIALGSSQTHSIGDGGADLDWVTFTLMQGTDIQIETSGQSGDTRLFFYEDSLSGLYCLDWDDDTGVGLFSSLTCFGVSAGDYYVMVEEFDNDDEISSYQLNVTELSLNDAFEPDDDYLDSSPISAGLEQVHAIGDNGNDEDWVSFTLYSEGRVWVETYGYSGDTEIQLFSSSGVPGSDIAADDDSGEGYFSRIITDPLPAGEYYVRIAAYSGFWGAEVIPEYGIILYTDPSVPLGHSIASGASSIGLSWSAPASDGGFDVLGYELFRGTSPGAMSAFRTVAGLAFTDINVSLGETYYYKVRALTDFGSSVFTTPSAGAITGGAAVSRPDAVGQITKTEYEDRIVLAWSVPYNHGSAITGYVIYRSEDASTPIQLGTCVDCTFTDDSVVRGKTYYYWVSAVNGVGEGDRSAAMQATAKATTGGLDLMVIIAIVGVAAALIVVVLAVVLRRRASTVPPAQPSQPMKSEESSMLANCPSCGAPSSGGSFCGHCGRKL